MTDTDIQLLQLLRGKSKSDPKFFGLAVQSMTAGLEDAAKLAREQSVQWETIAVMALGQKLDGHTRTVIAEKIEQLKDVASYNWTRLLERVKP